MSACEVVRHTTIHIMCDVLIFGKLQYSEILCSWRLPDIIPFTIPS